MSDVFTKLTYLGKELAENGETEAAEIVEGAENAIVEYQAEIIYLRTENERLRAALGEYANPDNWYTWSGFTDTTAWDWDRRDGNSNGYDIAQKALKGGKS